MRKTLRVLATLAALATVAGGPPAAAGEARVAVASNFTAPARALAARFQERSGHRLTLAFGSTGKHYAQIRNGAPFDAFLAADARRPRLLEEAGDALPGSRFTYALGQVVLWSPRPGYVDDQGRVLSQGDFRHLAIANPRLAPYGRAARQVLEALGLWEALSGRRVRGENIAQAFQFVHSGNAELGFVARSQVQRPGGERGGSWWAVPPDLYDPIEQQAVLLGEDPAARAFLEYLRTPGAVALIRRFGYRVPDAQ